MDPYHNMFEDSVSVGSKKRRKAGFSTPGVIAVIAVVVIIIAVWWLIDNNNQYNTADNFRVGDATTTIPNQQRDTFNDGNDFLNSVRTAQTEARRNLIAAQARLQSDQNYQEALTSVQGLRADLERAYTSTTSVTSTTATATQAIRTGWNSLKTQFDELETNLRNGSAESLTMLAALIATLGQDVRTDEGEND